MKYHLSMNRYTLFALLLLLTVASCGRRGIGSSVGGELTGVPVGKVWSEPTPTTWCWYRGAPTRWGQVSSIPLGHHHPLRGSIGGRFLDGRDRDYQLAIQAVRLLGTRPIIRERLADPAYAGDDFYKITEDEYGEPITPASTGRSPSPGNSTPRRKRRLSRASTPPIPLPVKPCWTSAN